MRKYTDYVLPPEEWVIAFNEGMDDIGMGEVSLEVGGEFQTLMSLMENAPIQNQMIRSATPSYSTLVIPWIGRQVRPQTSSMKRSIYLILKSQILPTASN